jgi:hypothetical protein
MSRRMTVATALACAEVMVCTFLLLSGGLPEVQLGDGQHGGGVDVGRVHLERH